MRFKLVILFAFIASALDAQIGLRPDFFIEQTAPTNANFEVYSQKSGLPRRASLANLKKPLSPFITDTVDYIPAATGNLTDLASFVWDTTGLLWYIDGEGDAVSFDGGAGGGAVSDGDYGDITVSGTGTVWNIDAGVVGPTELANTAVTPASYTLTGLTVDADGRLTAASSGTIGSGTNGDMAVWSGANTLTSQTDGKFIYDNNLTYGQGTALRSAYWSNDTTLAPTLIEYSSTLYDADAITGAFGLPTGTTAERPTATLGRIRANSTLGDVEFGNGTLFRSVVESMAGTFTPGEIAYFNTAGVLSDTTPAGILSMIAGLSGSGVAPRIPVYNGTSTFTNYSNFLYSGTSLSVATTNNTYPLEVGTGGSRHAPQSADPAGSGGVKFFDSDDNWFKGYNGTQFWFFARSDDVDPGVNRIWFQNAANTAQTTSNNLTFNGTNMRIETGDIQFGSGARGVFNSAGNIGWEFNSGSIFAELGGSGSQVYVEFEGVSARIGRRFTGSSANQRLVNVFGVQAPQYSALTGADTYIVSERPTASDANNIRIYAAHGSDASSGGSIFLDPGGSVGNGSYTGLSGIISLTVPVDKDSLETVSWKAIEISGRNKVRPTIHLFHLDTTQTAIKTLFLEGDTVKYRIENIGVISTSTDGSGDVTVTHGMGTTPTYIDVQPTGTTPWITSIHTIGGTTFKVRFYDAAGAAVTSTAVTATWLGKT